MAEYRAIREKYSILEVIRTPELSAEVTLQPIEAFDFDAAIIFAFAILLFSKIQKLLYFQLHSALVSYSTEGKSSK